MNHSYRRDFALKNILFNNIKNENLHNILSNDGRKKKFKINFIKQIWKKYFPTVEIILAKKRSIKSIIIFPKESSGYQQKFDKNGIKIVGIIKISALSFCITLIEKNHISIIVFNSQKMNQQQVFVFQTKLILMTNISKKFKEQLLKILSHHWFSKNKAQIIIIWMIYSCKIHVMTSTFGIKLYFFI